MKKFILLGVFLLAAMLTMAQQTTISGVLVDKSSHEALVQ